jgi:DNA repair protein RadA/Sms
MSEVDRVLGGGIVVGSMVLLGGAPGVGKSTLMLQIAKGFSENGKKVLYVSGEESLAQSAGRAKRIGIKKSSVYMLSESNLEVILDQSLKERPDLLVLDSIQTVFLPEVASAPGSVTQVRESAAKCLALAKKTGITIFLIGHINKEGQIAGPKVLEHMVDTVLLFEGEGTYQYRILRNQKNRFGKAFEMAVMQMNPQGLEEILNPSELFLSDRSEAKPGSVVFPSLEGSRPILCEIQSLCVSTHLAIPRRTAVGLDLNRIHLITAILERHGGVSFSQTDLYVSAVGGLEVKEPASDLAVAISMVSTKKNRAAHTDCIFIGELGLTGEVRPVDQLDLRIQEALRLGFTKFFVPARQLEQLELPKKVEIFPSRDIRRSLDLFLRHSWSFDPEQPSSSEPKRNLEKFHPREEAKKQDGANREFENEL